MISRQRRIANRLASVAVSVNCQWRGPKRRVSSAPSGPASSLGSIVVIPRAIRADAAATVGAGEWPAIAPVSPRQKST